MADIFSRQLRSKIMASVKSRNTKPELLLRKKLFNKGHRFRVNYPIEGRPDIVFVKFRVAIFVDGCFWHGCSCSSIPISNKHYWILKIKRNAARDKDVNSALRKQGWKVIRIWEHQLSRNSDNCTSRIENALSKLNRKVYKQ